MERGESQPTAARTGSDASRDDEERSLLDGPTRPGGAHEAFARALDRGRRVRVGACRSHALVTLMAIAGRPVIVSAGILQRRWVAADGGNRKSIPRAAGATSYARGVFG